MVVNERDETSRWVLLFGMFFPDMGPGSIHGAIALLSLFFVQSKLLHDEVDAMGGCNWKGTAEWVLVPHALLLSSRFLLQVPSRLQYGEWLLPLSRRIRTNLVSCCVDSLLKKRNPRYLKCSPRLLFRLEQRQCWPGLFALLAVRHLSHPPSHLRSAGV